jgi:hypothetical protein
MPALSAIFRARCQAPHRFAGPQGLGPLQDADFVCPGDGIVAGGNAQFPVDGSMSPPSNCGQARSADTTCNHSLAGSSSPRSRQTQANGRSSAVLAAH